MKTSYHACLWLMLWSTLIDSAAAQSLSSLPNQEFLILEVDKARLKASLKTWPENPMNSIELATFRVALGRQDGDKQEEGDLKTPEGIYLPKSILHGRSLPKKYGAMAIPINFPNQYDQMLGKTGHGIWLHGVEADNRVDAAKVTEGCIAFYNRDIRFLSQLFQPHQAVIMIAAEGNQLNKARDIHAITQQTRLWYHSWQQRDLDSFMAHYSADFRQRNHNKSWYRKHKQRIFSLYDQIQLHYTDLRVFTHKNYGIAMSNQDFRGDRHYASKGRKVLYWQRQEDGSFAIIREEFTRRRLIPTALTQDHMAYLKNSVKTHSRAAAKTEKM